MRTIHLISNAHIDPVWLWEWEEGAATAIATFRTAADLCEEFDGYIFNHNEALLYQWIEEYEPALFARIQRLVREGRWHIMGGWFLQPDCNMPAGESFVRQILQGRRYFAEKFGVRPTTAINFDPFGHTRGLVQIMAKCGYDSYIVCRPDQSDCPLENDEFIWDGYDGSQVLVNRPYGWYNSPLGKAREKAESFILNGPQTPSSIMLWGVGNHGGGPSRKDLVDLAALMAEHSDVAIVHSTPESYFAELQTRRDSLPVRRRDLNPWGVGCYTSMIRIKQKHRRLENELFATEKMATAAWLQGRMEYPAAELHDAQRDLSMAQFHDILPGSSIQPVEETSLRLMDHGLETLARVKARAFFALAQGQPAANKDETPILVYNPHPFPIDAVVECEFQLADQNWTDAETDVTVYRRNEPLASQVEQELSNLNLDWRKRIVFRAELAPAQMNRFDCRFSARAPAPATLHHSDDATFRFVTPDIEAVINHRTGLLDVYRAHGVDALLPNSCCPLVLLDDADPWGTRVRRFRNVLGAFRLLSADEAARISGVLNPALPAVRVIEDGAVRTVVEAVLGYGASTAVLRYKLPKQGTTIAIEVCVHWQERDRMLKLSFPTPATAGSYIGQVAYGVDELPGNGDEAVAQKWVAVVDSSRNLALTLINDGVYGSDFCHGEVRLSLLRSPSYAGHPIFDRPITPQDRYTPRIDQGERLFRFWLNAGPVAERLTRIDREALIYNETPMALSFFPAGGDDEPRSAVTLDGDAVQLTALKRAEDDDALIARLFNPTATRQCTRLRLSSLNVDQEITLGALEVYTCRIDRTSGELRTVNLLEEEKT